MLCLLLWFRSEAAWGNPFRPWLSVGRFAEDSFRLQRGSSPNRNHLGHDSVGSMARGFGGTVELSNAVDRRVQSAT